MAELIARYMSKNNDYLYYLNKVMQHIIIECDTDIFETNIIASKWNNITQNVINYKLMCKNIKITGDWDYAELQIGGMIIEKIYSDVCNVFSTTKSWIPQLDYYQIMVVVHSTSNNYTVTYDGSSSRCCDKEYLSRRMIQWEKYKTKSNNMSIINIGGDIYNYLPICGLYVKPSSKCKYVFIETSIKKHNCNIIAPLFYDSKKQIWILNNLLKYPFKLDYFDYIKLICIPKNNNINEMNVTIYMGHYNIYKIETSTGLNGFVFLNY